MSYCPLMTSLGWKPCSKTVAGPRLSLRYSVPQVLRQTGSGVMRSTCTRWSAAALTGSSNWGQAGATALVGGAAGVAGSVAAEVAKTAERETTTAAARRRRRDVIMGSTISVLRRRAGDHHPYGGVSPPSGRPGVDQRKMPVWPSE